MNVNRKSGDNIVGVTPVPISNTVVKPFRADDTWWEAAWESRTSPVFYCDHRSLINDLFQHYQVAKETSFLFALVMVY